MKVLDVVACIRCHTNSVKTRNTNHVFEVMYYTFIQINAVKPLIKESCTVLKKWNQEDSNLTL